MAKSRTFDIIFRTKGTDRAQKDVGDIDNRISGLATTAKQTATILSTALATATVAIGAKAVKTAGEFEMLRVRLKGLTGSQKEANRLFDEFNQIAAKTPFSVQEVIDAGATLQAFGLDAENLLTGIADLAAFMQVDIATAAQNFGRAMNAGAGAADMFRDKGINQLVASFAGVKNVTELTLPQFQEALQKFIIDPSQPVAGATALMAETLEGKFSNAGDAVDRLAAELGDKLLPTVKAVTDLFIEFVDKLDVDRIASYGIAIGTLSGAFGIYRVSVLAAANATKVFRTALITSGVGAAIVGLGELINIGMKYVDSKKEEAEQEKENLSLRGIVVKRLSEEAEARKKITQQRNESIKRLEKINEENRKRIELALQVTIAESAQAETELAYQDSLAGSFAEFVDIQHKMLANKEKEQKFTDWFVANYPKEAKALGMLSSEQLKNQELMKQSINLSGILSSSLQTAFDPDLSSGEAFKGFVLQVISAIQGVVLASKAMNEALTVAFIPGVGTGAAIAALIALEAAKAAVRSIKFAKHGMDEMVSQPTLIMAGEAGPERVQVTPAGRPSANKESNGITLVFNGPVTDEQFIRDKIVPEINKVNSMGLA